MERGGQIVEAISRLREGQRVSVKWYAILGALAAKLAKFLSHTCGS